MSSLPAASLQLTLSYICEYLYDLGLPDLTPEVFWQAKFEAQVVSQNLFTCSEVPAALPLT